MLDKILPNLDEIGQDDGRDAEIETRISEDALLMPISELELNPPIAVEQSTSVRQAILHMVERNVGCLLVLENGRLTGIVTERDILMKVAGTGSDFEGKSVGEIMTPNPRTLQADALIIDAIAMMDRGGYRRVPVVDRDGQPMGLVSVRKIVDHLVEYFPEQVVNLPPNPVRKMESREGA